MKEKLAAATLKFWIGVGDGAGGVGDGGTGVGVGVAAVGVGVSWVGETLGKGVVNGTGVAGSTEGVASGPGLGVALEVGAGEG